MKPLFSKCRVELTRLDLLQLRFFQLMGAISFICLVLVATIVGISGLIRVLL